MILLTNASCAFLLNVAVVFLIGCASSLVLTLSGVIKVRSRMHSLRASRYEKHRTSFSLLARSSCSVRPSLSYNS